MAEVQFVVDVSHHKKDPLLDLKTAKRQGIAGVLAKATEGAGMVDETFGAYRKAAEAAGMLFGGYHFQRSDSSVAEQVKNVKRVVPTTVPIAVDVERNSGNVALTRTLVKALRAEGYRVLWTYLPFWYWQQIGSPDLSGLPPLWSSRYPDMVVGPLAGEWDDVNEATFWKPYGGNVITLGQFTSSLAIGNYGRGSIDCSAFRGTYEQLAAYWRGGKVEDDMQLDDKMHKDGSWTPPGDGTFHHVIVGIHQAAFRNLNNNTKLDALTSAISAATHNPDITAEEMRSVVEQAVAANNEQLVDQLVSAQQPQLLELFTRAVGADQAQELAQSVADLLRGTASAEAPVAETKESV